MHDPGDAPRDVITLYASLDDEAAACELAADRPTSDGDPAW